MKKDTKMTREEMEALIKACKLADQAETIRARCAKGRRSFDWKMVFNSGSGDSYELFGVADTKEELREIARTRRTTVLSREGFSRDRLNPDIFSWKLASERDWLTVVDLKI